MPELSTKKVEQAPLHFPQQKIPRRLIKTVANCKLSAHKQNGLYAYIALKTCSVPFYIDEQHANLILSKHHLCRLLMVRRAKEAEDVLDKLREYNLLSWWIDPLTKEYMVSFFENQSIDARERKRLLSCATNGYGFLFVSKNIVNQFAGTHFSEADIFVDLWLSVVFRDAHNCVSNVCPMTVFRVQNHAVGCHRYEWLACRYGYSLSGIYFLFQRLLKKHIVDITSIQGRGTLIFIPFFCDLLFKLHPKRMDRKWFSEDIVQKHIFSGMTYRLNDAGKWLANEIEWAKASGFC